MGSRNVVVAITAVVAACASIASAPVALAGPAVPEDTAVVWVTTDGDELVGVDVDGTAPLTRFALCGEPADRLTDKCRLEGVAVADGSVWVTTGGGGTLLRVDPATGAIAGTVEFAKGAPTRVVSDGTALWVTDRKRDVVVRIDPVSAAIVKRIKVGDGPTGVAAGPDGVWVANHEGGSVSRIDPATNKVTATYRVRGEPEAIAIVNGNSALVQTLLVGKDECRGQTHREVYRLQGARSVKQFAATVPDTGCGSPGIAVAGDSVWTASPQPAILRYHLDGKPDFPVDTSGVTWGHTSGAGSLWAFEAGYVLLRVDPVTAEIVKRYETTEASPNAMAVG